MDHNVEKFTSWKEDGNVQIKGRTKMYRSKSEDNCHVTIVG